jgi:hypothetical protein
MERIWGDLDVLRTNGWLVRLAQQRRDASFRCLCYRYAGRCMPTNVPREMTLRTGELGTGARSRR